MKEIAVVAACMLVVSPAEAGFNRWSIKVDKDPFDNRGKLTLMNADSRSTGLLIMCEQGSDEITVRYASPFPYDQAAKPDPIASFKLAFDTGQRHDGVAAVGLLGTGNMGFDAPFANEEAKKILSSFASARSKIYIKINTNDPSAFTARGSTNAARRALSYCFSS